MGAGSKDYTLFIESDGKREMVYEVPIIERNAVSGFRSLKKMVAAAANVGESATCAAEAIAKTMTALAQQAKS